VMKPSNSLLRKDSETMDKPISIGLSRVYHSVHSESTD
jgi:hypothetical protein